MDKNAIKSDGKAAEIAPEVAGLGAEERARLSEIKERLEANVASFDGREMWYQERMLQFQGTAHITCLLYTSPSPRDATLSRMPSSA